MADMNFKLAIEGMHCGGCVRRVTKALEEIPGVSLGKVDVGEATGTLDSDDTDVAELVAAIDRLGFHAKPAGA